MQLRFQLKHIFMTKIFYLEYLTYFTNSLAVFEGCLGYTGIFRNFTNFSGYFWNKNYWNRLCNIYKIEML